MSVCTWFQVMAKLQPPREPVSPAEGSTRKKQMKSTRKMNRKHMKIKKTKSDPPSHIVSSFELRVSTGNFKTKMCVFWLLFFSFLGMKIDENRLQALVDTQTRVATLLAGALGTLSSALVESDI